MRLILVLAGVISVAWASSRGGPPRNSIRRGGPFYHHHGTPRQHPHPHPPRPARSHYSHHSAYPSHGHGHGHHPNPSYGGGGGHGLNHNYAFVAGGGGHGISHGHQHEHGYHQHQQVFGVQGGGQALKSLTQAFSPVQPPIVSISPIIPYQPGLELPGQESHSDHGHGPTHSGPAHGHGHGTSTISKSVYVFSAPPDPSDHIRPQIVKQFPQQKQKHYQVLFINAPPPPPHPQHTVELPQPPEMKTQIYVLVKKPQPAPPVKIIPANVPVHKPEVYFIRYKNNKDGAAGYVPVPSDAPIIYPQPHGVDYGHPHPEQEIVYQDQPQLLHQPQLEFQDYNSLTPVHEQQQEQHHHQPIEYIPQEQPGGHGYGGQEEILQQYAPHHVHPQHYGGGGGGGEGIQYSVGGGDPYSDHSRLSAHFSTVTGRPVTFNARSSPSSTPQTKTNPKKRRLRSKSISRSDDLWTPIVQSNNHVKRELDAGMSGI